jgi:hypothetical protein
LVSTDSQYTFTVVSCRPCVSRSVAWQRVALVFRGPVPRSRVSCPGLRFCDEFVPHNTGTPQTKESDTNKRVSSGPVGGDATPDIAVRVALRRKPPLVAHCRERTLHIQIHQHARVASCVLAPVGGIGVRHCLHVQVRVEIVARALSSIPLSTVLRIWSRTPKARM